MVFTHVNILATGMQKHLTGKCVCTDVKREWNIERTNRMKISKRPKMRVFEWNGNIEPEPETTNQPTTTYTHSKTRTIITYFDLRENRHLKFQSFIYNWRCRCFYHRRCDTILCAIFVLCYFCRWCIRVCVCVRIVFICAVTCKLGTRAHRQQDAHTTPIDIHKHIYNFYYLISLPWFLNASTWTR